ncbi:MULTISPECIES: hypothetical protein [Burkholderia]|nr:MULTISPECIES: hypothetical protein [Burkholderia]MBY4870675.1 hypothetical protein [Burkholderia anthina]
MKNTLALAVLVALFSALGGCCLLPYCGGWGGPQGAIIVPHPSALS